MSWQFWIDRGGTFTDIVASTPDGRLLSGKWLSDNPQQYADAALHGIQSLLQQENQPDAAIEVVKMGTTVGTNALLERKGAPVALITNRGLGDVLRIGYQNRPHIFALNIQLPRPLYQQVIEIDTRVDAQGHELAPVDHQAVERALQNAYDQGIRSLAIVLMHSWRYPQHELHLSVIARTLGFTQISLSHQVSPLPKMVSRGDTTVVDAYLSPVLGKYVDHVQQGLSNTRWLFMQSNGGLVDARYFQGKDSILSGPAGGLVGAIAVSRRAGFKHIIAFDMGGTSTDVAHYAGQLERTLDSELAGVRMRVPMMAINTVAAGGGSILQFDGHRYRVGPQSAGANPGPACYRRGGPLTVTDANLLLGKLPDFPSVFGASGDLPPDRDLVRQRFAELTERINRESGQNLNSYQVAEGFLAVAVDNMAQAIKKISVQKGYPLAEYVLCCYGAAGAQHACLLADQLGMSQIVLHPLAGVLSAYGMGLADFRVVKQQAVERPWTEVTASELNAIVNDLLRQARSALRQQHIAEQDIRCERRVSLRYHGTDTALTLAYDEPDDLPEHFAALHHQQFGFVHTARPLILVELQVECIGHAANLEQHAVALAQTPTTHSQRSTQMFSRNSWHEAPVHQRAALSVGQIIQGPAIVLESTSTIVIEPGWQSQVNAFGDLLLTRSQPQQNPKPRPDKVDPLWLELFNKQFTAIAEHMGFVLQNTAHSVNIKERLDFSCALFDAQGQLIANAPHIPVHLGSMGDSVQGLLQRGVVFQAGDAWLINSPYAGGTHLPDITVVSPVFNQAQQLLFFVASRGHHADVGGIAPGSMPANSRHIEDEGVISDGLLILRQGQFQAEGVRQWLSENPHPARNPEQNLADLQAQIAANHKGIHELLSMLERYSQQTVMAYVGYVQDHAEACVKQLLQQLDDGTFHYPTDHGAVIQVSVRIASDRQTAVIDFSGSSAQLTNNFNAPSAVCKAAVLYVFRSLLADDIPLNAGCLRPLRLIVPQGCLLNPTYPAAVVAGNVETSQAIVNALFGALGKLAAAQGTMNNFSFGDAEHQYYETICGGTGAGEGFDGASAVQSHMTNSRITDPEILEQRFPVLLKQFAIRQGSGGDGRWRGGEGVVREMAFRQTMSVSILSGHRQVAPFGLQGGHPGATGRNTRVHVDGSVEVLDGCVSVEVKAGEAIRIETPGGGGFGEAE